MSLSEATSIIHSLANGIDPETGEILPRDGVFNNPQVIRALFEAHKALEKASLRKPSSPPSANAGSAWTEQEDAQLVEGFDARISLKDLAAKHGRSQGAIGARLVRLGKVENRSAARLLLAA